MNGIEIVTAELAERDRRIVVLRRELAGAQYRVTPDDDQPGETWDDAYERSQRELAKARASIAAWRADYEGKQEDYVDERDKRDRLASLLHQVRILVPPGGSIDYTEPDKALASGEVE